MGAAMRFVISTLIQSSPALAETALPPALQSLLNYHTTACELTGGALTIGQNAAVEANLDGDTTPTTSSTVPPSAAPRLRRSSAAKASAAS
jgi:hypothetical protein